MAIPAPPLPPALSSHHHYQQQQLQQTCNSHCSLHPYNHNQVPPNSFYNPSAYNQPCSMHMQHNFVPPNGYYQPQQNLPHSKSLDQYDGKLPQNGINQHRLSLDHSYKMNQHLSPSQQQTAMPPFDCIDSVAFDHPYNQPNARSPLPYTLSSNLGHMQQMQQEQYYPNAMHNHYPRMYDTDYYHQQMMQQQIPTSVSDFHQKSYDFTDSSSPAMPENELISFGNEATVHRSKPAEVKLRSSLKKSTQSTSDSVDMEPDLNDLRALKRNKPVAQTSTNSDIKARDGIGNYQTWDYVFQNLEKETNMKNMAGNHDDKLAAELQLENLKISNGHPSKHHHKSNGNPHRMSETSARSSSGNHTSSVQTKTRTKSVSTVTEASNHEHKRTSSVMETNSRSNNKHKPTQQQIFVPPGEWSCRFCTFLNPDAKKICDMCSKSKDFFLDADKNPATATCV